MSVSYAFNSGKLQSVSILILKNSFIRGKTILYGKNKTKTRTDRIRNKRNTRLRQHMKMVFKWIRNKNFCKKLINFDISNASTTN